ncbi:MAG: ABC transporter ATP-binding protein, partial [Clostridiales bacterium]|nr:ABC transporter ATP-binding protein [Clostridiales bacterium]
DLDKCADYIIFIKNGEIIASTTKDKLLESHLVVRGAGDALQKEQAGKIIGLKKHSFGFSGLIKKDDLSLFSGIETEKPNLEDIMVYYNREG